MVVVVVRGAVVSVMVMVMFVFVFVGGGVNIASVASGGDTGKHQHAFGLRNARVVVTDLVGVAARSVVMVTEAQTSGFAAPDGTHQQEDAEEREAHAASE